MLVKQVRELGDLGVAPLWEPAQALERSVTGITIADMRNPARYLSPGKIVLTGLTWWRPHHSETAPAFVAAARAAGTVALIAGEGMHGHVPEELVEACRLHDLPLFSVPSTTTFGEILDRLYLLLWGDLRGSANAAALPAVVREELRDSVTSVAGIHDILTRACRGLGLPDLALVSATDRVIASSGPHTADSPGGTRVPVGAGGRSPFDGRWLRANQAVDVTQRPVLDELADLLSMRMRQHRQQPTEQATAAPELLTALDNGNTAAVTDILYRCGLPTTVEVVPLVVRIPGAPTTWAVDAANELLAASTAPFVACEAASGESVTFTAAPPHDLVRCMSESLPAMQNLVDGDPAIAVGLGPSADSSSLAEAVAGARYTATAAQRPGSEQQVRAVARMTSLPALLEGLPTSVSHAFQTHVLGPVINYDARKGTQLLQTLKTFLDHNASWSKTATAMHLHVNTTHYRIERVEALTGRQIADLNDRTDLHTALILYQQSKESTEMPK